MNTFTKNLNSVIVIAYRDVLKFFKDKSRIVATFIFPAVFIGILGKSFQASTGQFVPYDPLFFVFTGVIAQTLFQSSAQGIISLIEDRENDFSQEIFVSPISRYAIIFGKILGESLVALLQVIGVIAFGYIIGTSLSGAQILAALPIFLLACLFGATFGVLVLANLSSQRAANQIFPFIMFPQFFVSGIFTPIKDLPIVLFGLSRIAPMTYIVDLLRNVIYKVGGEKGAEAVLLYPLWIDLTVVLGMLVIFLVLGTLLFVRNEKNR
jgi:ABC-2 type transport system permease protein